MPEACVHPGGAPSGGCGGWGATRALQVQAFRSSRRGGGGRSRRPRLPTVLWIGGSVVRLTAFFFLAAAAFLTLSEGILLVVFGAEVRAHNQPPAWGRWCGVVRTSTVDASRTLQKA